MIAQVNWAITSFFVLFNNQSIHPKVHHLWASAVKFIWKAQTNSGAPRTERVRVLRHRTCAAQTIHRSLTLDFKRPDSNPARRLRHWILPWSAQDGPPCNDLWLKPSPMRSSSAERVACRRGSKAHVIATFMGISKEQARRHPPERRPHFRIDVQ